MPNTIPIKKVDPEITLHSTELRGFVEVPFYYSTKGGRLSR